MELNKDSFTIEDFEKILSELFSIEKLKQLLKETFEFDYDKHKGEIKFLPLTIVEWYKSDIFKERLSLNNIKGNILERYRPFNTRGTHFPKQKSIAIFFPRSNIVSFLKYYQVTLDVIIASYVRAVFHELEHHYISIRKKSINGISQLDLNMFSSLVCDIIHFYNPQHYKKYHDMYWVEIDADLYGVDRAKEFLESKEMLTDDAKSYLEKLKNESLFMSTNYDLHFFLHELHEIIKRNPKMNFDSCGYLLLFYKNSKKFNSVDVILKLATELNVDKQILDYFFSSKDFLDSLHFHFLSSEHKKIIMNAIEYALQIEINRRKKNKEFLQNKQISSKVYLSVDARICSKIAYLNKN